MRSVMMEDVEENQLKTVLKTWQNIKENNEAWRRIGRMKIMNNEDEWRGMKRNEEEWRN